MARCSMPAKGESGSRFDAVKAHDSWFKIFYRSLARKPMAQMKAGQAVIEALRAEGVEYTFGVVGTTTNSIVTEMYGRTDIHFVDTRHEEGAAFMAYGYARASGKPAACFTTSGPGTINLIP